VAEESEEGTRQLYLFIKILRISGFDPQRRAVPEVSRRVSRRPTCSARDILLQTSRSPDFGSFVIVVIVTLALDRDDHSVSISKGSFYVTAAVTAVIR
jgi:hypothetical protein